MQNTACTAFTAPPTASIAPIEGPRLTLRLWREADRDPFRALNADPRVMRHFPSPLSADASDALMARIQRGFAENGFGLWALDIPRASPNARGSRPITALPASSASRARRLRPRRLKLPGGLRCRFKRRDLPQKRRHSRSKRASRASASKGSSPSRPSAMSRAGD